MTRIPHMRRYLTALLGLVVLQACSGSSDSTTGPGSSGTISLSLGTTSATVEQGGSVQVVATLTRGGGYTGAVSFAVQGVPSGVSGSVSNAVTTGTTSTATVTVAVDASTAPGTYSLTVRATGSGVTDAVQTFTLTVTAPAASSFTLGLSPAALSLAQGDSGTIQVSLTRTNYTGSVNLSVTTPVTGVTTSFNPNNTTGSTSTLTVKVAPSVAPGQHTIVVGSVASGQPDHVASFVLTVTAAGSYTLAVQPATISLAQGANGTATVRLTRSGGFSGSVALSVTGAPAGLTATLSPTSTTGDSASLSLGAGAALAAGTYTLTVHGSATGLTEQTASLGVTVTTSGGGGGGGGGNVTIDFSSCPASYKPVWFAYQDGTGPWTPITGTNDSYSFTISSGKGGMAWVQGQGGVLIQYYAQSEFTSGQIAFCSALGSDSIHGTVAGLAAGQHAAISYGGQATDVVAPATSWALGNLKAGTFDLIGYATSALAPSASDRMIIARDQTIANGGSAGLLDFGSAAAFAPASAAITVANAGSDNVIGQMYYVTGSTCSSAQLWTNVNAGASFTAFGVPAAQQRASDLHQLGITASASGGTGLRYIAEEFHTLADRTVTLPPALPAPTVTSLTGNYERLQTTLAAPAQYQTAYTFQYVSLANGKLISMTQTHGYAGNTSPTFVTPSFSGLAGWNDSYAPATGTVSWSASVVQSTFTGLLPCQDGGSITEASVTGSAN